MSLAAARALLWLPNPFAGCTPDIGAACPYTYMPVCADGESYSNACIAEAACHPEATAEACDGMEGAARDTEVWPCPPEGPWPNPPGCGESVLGGLGSLFGDIGPAELVDPADLALHLAAAAGSKGEECAACVSDGAHSWQQDQCEDTICPIADTACIKTAIACNYFYAVDGNAAAAAARDLGDCDAGKVLNFFGACVTPLPGHLDEGGGGGGESGPAEPKPANPCKSEPVPWGTIPESSAFWPCPPQGLAAVCTPHSTAVAAPQPPCASRYRSLAQSTRANIISLLLVCRGCSLTGTGTITS